MATQYRTSPFSRCGCLALLKQKELQVVGTEAEIHHMYAVTVHVFHFGKI